MKTETIKILSDEIKLVLNGKSDECLQKLLKNIDDYLFRMEDDGK